MEVIMSLTCAILALAFLLDKAKDFIAQLKQNGSAKLSKGFTAQLSVVPIDKKSEENADHISSLNDGTE